MQLTLTFDPRWSEELTQALSEHVDFEDPDAFNDVFDMTLSYFQWKTKRIVAGEDDERDWALVLEVMQGVGLTTSDVPPQVLKLIWDRFYDELAGTLIDFDRTHGIAFLQRVVFDDSPRVMHALIVHKFMPWTTP